MNLHGIHHITSITGDARRNVDFYTRVLGLRMVKKTVNQDDPTVYHLFYADDRGSAGADLTFFEYPGARPGRAGAGMVHLIVLRAGSAGGARLLGAAARRPKASTTRREGDSLFFADPEGLALRASRRRDRGRAARRQQPADPAGARAPGLRQRPRLRRRPRAQPAVPRGDRVRAARRTGWEVAGAYRGSTYHYDEPPAEPGIPGAGTIHHVAWSAPMDEHESWVERVAAAGGQPTPVIDRFWFRSIYFREPSGVLFEIASLGPGFDVDEPLEHLGESLVLPPRFEPMRPQIEQALTPL